MTYVVQVINCSQQTCSLSVALLESLSEFVLLHFCSGSDPVFFCCHTGKKMCNTPRRSSQKSHWASALTAGGFVVVFTLARLHMSVHTLLLCFTRLLLNLSVGECHFSIMQLLLLLLIPVWPRTLSRYPPHLQKDKKDINRWDYNYSINSVGE